MAEVRPAADAPGWRFRGLGLVYWLFCRHKKTAAVGRRRGRPAQGRQGRTLVLVPLAGGAPEMLVRPSISGHRSGKTIFARLLMIAAGIWLGLGVGLITLHFT
jgi:hypothetical protein